MALLAFEIPRWLASTPASGVVVPESIPMPDSIAELLDLNQRIKTATELNAAILTSQSHGKEPKLPGLLKMLAWGEGMLAEQSDFPKCKLATCVPHYVLILFIFTPISFFWRTGDFAGLLSSHPLTTTSAPPSSSSALPLDNEVIML